MPPPANQSGTASMPPAFPALALGASCREAHSPDREEPGVARADAGESLRLTSNAPSAKRVSCSKIPRRRACHRRRTNPAPHRCHPHSPRSRLGLLVGRHTLPIVRSRGWHAQTLGNLCDSRATPRRPSGCPVAKSPGGEHATAGEPIRHRIDATRIPRARAWGFLKVRLTPLHFLTEGVRSPRHRARRCGCGHTHPWGERRSSRRRSHRAHQNGHPSRLPRLSARRNRR